MTKYGYNTLAVVAVISFILIVVSIYVNSNFVKIGLIVLVVLLIVFSINFFRDPERNVPQKEGIVLSPADGNVMLIKKIMMNRFFEGEAWQVSVFMSPLNVHVNRIPISGSVSYLDYVEGKFLTAFSDKADKDNERMEIGITSKYGKVFFTQVAGFVARRIVTDLKLDQSVIAGERFGMIKFGSRVDIIVPINWEPQVREGDLVTAGESIIFEINK